MGAGSYGGPSQQRQGGGGPNSEDRTVFVGNLGFNSKEQDISEVFRKERINPVRIRMMQDQDGKFKGAAFVEFDNKEDADRACRLNGSAMGGTDRRLRINPASNKPPGR